MEQYLRCTVTIDCDQESIREAAQRVTKDLTTEKEKAIALYYFVRDSIRHNAYAPLYIPERYKASVTLKEGNGFCQHKAILLAALARVVGIPSRIGFVDVQDHRLSDTFKKMIGDIDVFPGHGYCELYVNGKWVHVSPAYDLATCQKNGFVPVDWDGENDAKDSPYDVNGNLHIVHINDHGCSDDFSYDELMGYYMEWVAGLGVDWNELKNKGESIRQTRSWGEG